MTEHQRNIPTVPFDGRDAQWSEFKREILITINAIKCSRVLELPDPNKAPKRWRLKCKDVQDKKGRPLLAESKTNQENYDKDLFAGSVLYKSCVIGIARHLVIHEEDAGRWSAMWPRVIQAYEKNEKKVVARERKRLIGAGNNEALPIKYDDDLDNETGLRTYQNEIACSHSELVRACNWIDPLSDQHDTIPEGTHIS